LLGSFILPRFLDNDDRYAFDVALILLMLLVLIDKLFTRITNCNYNARPKVECLDNVK
jgi:hypothetical protein